MKLLSLVVFFLTFSQWRNCIARLSFFYMTVSIRYLDDIKVTSAQHQLDREYNNTQLHFKWSLWLLYEIPISSSKIVLSYNLQLYETSKPRPSSSDPLRVLNKIILFSLQQFKSLLRLMCLVLLNIHFIWLSLMRPKTPI